MLLDFLAALPQVRDAPSPLLPFKLALLNSIKWKRKREKMSWGERRVKSEQQSESGFGGNGVNFKCERLRGGEVISSLHSPEFYTPLLLPVPTHNTICRQINATLKKHLVLHPTSPHT